jgi:DNA-binding response OmpR family regulator
VRKAQQRPKPVEVDAATADVNDRILIIDDDAVVHDVARASLERGGYIVDSAAGGGEGLALAASRCPALIVLDLGLPDMAGETVLREVRRRSPVPILVLSAKGRMEERVRGLDLGADDYMAKPFSMRELVARVHALLRRVERASQLAVDDTVIRVADIEIDTAERRVYVRGAEAQLTRTEFDLLCRLAERPGQVFERERLLADIWGFSEAAATRTVDSHVRALRRKLGPGVVRTVHGVGYALVRQ